MIQDSFKNIFENKKRILFVFAHPDDAEIYAGGTIARLTAEGKEVRVVKVTNGDNGSRQEAIASEQLRMTRRTEDAESMKILGIKPENNVYLDLTDGFVKADDGLLELLVYQVRHFKPDIVCTHDPERKIIRFDESFNYVNHRDHQNTALSVVDAVYPYSRDILFFPKQLEEQGVNSHTCTEFLFTDYFDHPDCVEIDVTDFIDVRTKAIAAHSSQYSTDDAQDSTDFFTMREGTERRYEKFRYVIAD